MGILILPLIGSFLLLWIPAHLFYSAELRDRVLDTHGSNGLPVTRLLPVWQNWMDLIRGFAGAYLVYRLSFPLERELGETYYYELVAIAGILAIAVAFQVVYYRNHLYCVSPVFFLVGVSFGVVDWWIVLYGVAAGLFVGRTINASEAFFIGMAATIGAISFVFHGVDPGWLIACAVLVLPVVISLTCQESLVAVIRRRTAASD